MAPAGNSGHLDVIVGKLLRKAMTIGGAERGNVQLVDHTVGGLRIAAHHGFDADFLDHFAVVADDGSACGRAAASLAQTVVEDVERDPAFEPHREIARASGFRAVQSTPLVDAAGALVGMVSTHYPEPHVPASDALALLEGYGRSFGALVAGHVGLSPVRTVDVLVVDDHEPVRSTLASILRLAGYTVAEAADGVEALEYVDDEDVSVGVMLLDVEMPRLDGIGLLRRVAAPPPTVVLSAVDHRREIRALDSKIFAFTRKPVPPGQILALVARALGGAGDPSSPMASGSPSAPSGQS